MTSVRACCIVAAALWLVQFKVKNEHAADAILFTAYSVLAFGYIFLLKKWGVL